MLNAFQSIVKNAIGSVLDELNEENEKFSKNMLDKEKIREKREDELIPPWFIGRPDIEDELKELVLNLSGDERTFLVPPPEGTEFKFDLNAYASSAKAALAFDSRLSETRFSMVPARLNENDFWRNYFYRVSLLKQQVLLNIPSDLGLGNRKPGQDVVFDVEKELEAPDTVEHEADVENWEDEIDKVLE